MRRFFILLISLSLVLGAAMDARAQQGLSYANLYTADLSAFPAVSASFDVFDSNGTFVSGLKPEAITVLEDEQPLRVDSLNEVAVPLQLVVAVNQGASLDTRDTTGASRFQRTAQVLAQWVQGRPTDQPDDYSLVSQAGPVINHAGAADFVVGLTSFKPDFRAAIPNLQSLTTAMDTVSAQTPQLGMKRAVLFITPYMNDPNLPTVLEAYAQRALEEKIRIFVWLIDLDTTFNTTNAAAFNNLAIRTGGSMFTYSGLERFPDPESYFSSLRRVYTFSYQSRVKSSGDHALSVQISLPAGALNSSTQAFSMDIQPPNPFPVASTLQITRRAPEDDPFNTELLVPTEQKVEIIAEFPDGHPRPLTRTTLYVDGVIVDENTTEPFLEFTWDLASYITTSEHQIVIEAVDSLGLSKSSMPVPVVVTVVQAPRGVSAFLARYRTPITFGAIIFAGLLLFAILLGGRLRVPSLRAAQAARKAEADPLTQSIQAIAESPAPVEAADKNKKRRILSKKAVADARLKKEAGASFIRIQPDGQVIPVAPINVVEPEIIFGTDPVQCSQILDDPSIALVHARLRQTDDGGYLLLDNNSVAGTWVNYEPIPREGYRLTHGDMIHFGQLIYRFTLLKPPVVARPTITVLDDSDYR